MTRLTEPNLSSICSAEQGNSSTLEFNSFSEHNEFRVAEQRSTKQVNDPIDVELAASRANFHDQIEHLPIKAKRTILALVLSKNFTAYDFDSGDQALVLQRLSKLVNSSITNTQLKESCYVLGFDDEESFQRRLNRLDKDTTPLCLEILEHLDKSDISKRIRNFIIEQTEEILTDNHTSNVSVMLRKFVTALKSDSFNALSEREKWQALVDYGGISSLPEADLSTPITKPQVVEISKIIESKEKAYSKEVSQQIDRLDRANKCVDPELNKRKSAYVRDLINLIENPSLLDQGDRSTCLATTALYDMLINEPALFAKFAADIFINGSSVKNEKSIFYKAPIWSLPDSRSVLERVLQSTMMEAADSRYNYTDNINGRDGNFDNTRRPVYSGAHLMEMAALLDILDGKVRVNIHGKRGCDLLIEGGVSVHRTLVSLKWGVFDTTTEWHKKGDNAYHALYYVDRINDRVIMRDPSLHTNQKAGQIVKYKDGLTFKIEDPVRSHISVTTTQFRQMFVEGAFIEENLPKLTFGQRIRLFFSVDE